MTKTEMLCRELDKFYTAYDNDAERMYGLAEKIYQSRGDKSALALRAELTEMLCQKSKIHLFRNFPFFYEFATGRQRYHWGGLFVGSGRILADKNADIWLNAYRDEINPYFTEGYVHGRDNPVGFDHHCLGYDTILEKGIFGIIKDIRKKQKETRDEEKLDFYYSAVDSLTSLMSLALRFSDKASSLAKRCKNEELRKHYERFAKAAENVPASPAQSFYEALCCIIFCREAIGSLEGIGVSIFGHLDRILYPYYEADIKNGVITREEAYHLIKCLLLYTETRFSKRTATRETSTTVVLGGCDADGNTVFNEVTKMFLEAVYEERTFGTKLLCRISSKHPDEYINLISAIQAANIPTLVVQNDESHIPSRVKHGQDIRDARLYVGV